MQIHRGRRFSLQLIVVAILVVAAALYLAGDHLLGAWALRSLRTAGSAEARLRSIEQVGRWRHDPAVPVLLELLRDPQTDEATRRAVVEAIARIAGAGD